MSKMFNWSSKKKQKENAQEHFFCPKCDHLSPYKVKPASVDFTFYYIPLFELGSLTEFVVCQVCKKGFDPKILAPRSQSMFKLAWATKCNSDRLSPETLREHTVYQTNLGPVV
jgi:hypothetical protein